ncbi:MAG: MmcQ/YjbR family DNA-binding protein [Devosia sp.]|uniref:MmcQ/YjbR family DNA-binding protein n=1 Tax=Devosia sp. TaxID=1871048 RepID=UPI001A3B52A2|nr:MmcQ/YjbR family DNA-binding protein [Devosia sp.]MBL8599141.1 MmcQ/YjbR family DNA-binding protein [Devosia sp.]
MATAADVRKLAMSLEGTTEHPHFERTAFKVRRIYATLAADGKSLNLNLTPEEQEFKTMLAPEVFTPIPNKWGTSGWTTVDLRAIGKAELKAALEMAWEHGRAKKA